MNALDKSILDKIKFLRSQSGISQTKMAEIMGISQTGYAKIENGTTESVSLPVAVAIAKALNIGFNELFDIDGDSQKIDNLTKEIDRLNKRILELEDNVQSKKDLINFLKDNKTLFYLARKIFEGEDGGVRARYFDSLLTGEKSFEEWEKGLNEVDFPFNEEDKKSMIDYISKYFKI